MILSILKKLWMGVALISAANSIKNDECLKNSNSRFVTVTDLEDGFQYCIIMVINGNPMLNAFAVKNVGNVGNVGKDFLSTLSTIDRDHQCGIDVDRIFMSKNSIEPIGHCLYKASKNRHTVFSTASVAFNKASDALNCTESFVRHDIIAPEEYWCPAPT